MLFPLDGLTHDSFRIYLLSYKHIHHWIYCWLALGLSLHVLEQIEKYWIGWSLEEKRNIYFSSQYLLEFPMGALLRSNRNLWKPLYSSNWIRMSPIQSKCNNSPAHIRAFYIIVAFLIFLQFISQFLLVNCSTLKPDIKQLLISMEVSPKNY